jgi:hypothetical protein
MAEKRIIFKCTNESCGTENEVSDVDLKAVGQKRIILTCFNCGKVNEPRKVDGKDDGNWLECIPFQGTEKNHVAGRIATSAGEVFWVNYKGNKLTAAQFASMHGVNPAVVWCNTHPEKPECKSAANKKTIALVNPPMVDLKKIPAVKLDKSGQIELDSKGRPIIIEPPDTGAIF